MTFPTFSASPPRAETSNVRRVVPLLLLFLAVPAWAGNVPATSCPMFPANNVWHADVSALPVHARSAAWLASASASTKHLHPDFGSSGDPDVPYGIPYQVVSSSHAKVNVTFDYADESDRVPYPLGSDTPIEGGAGSGGDMHTVVVDKDTCTLYETWYTQQTPSGWTAGSGAVFHLSSNTLRPAGWTSADAAGLPILPGLLRPDEVAAGHVDHAIRFTVARTDRSYVWPARHQAGSVNDANVPPMGARFRLKKSYALTGLRADTQTVLRAMQTYGMVVADNGSDWFFQGAASNSWPDGLIDQLKAVPASAFEAVDESSLMVSPDSAAVKSPPVWRHWTPTATPTPSRRTAAPRPGVTTPAPRPAATPTPRTTTPAPVAASTTPPATTPPSEPVADPPRDGPRPAGRALPWLPVVVPIVAGAVAVASWRRRSA
jgi:hypothetical protein